VATRKKPSTRTAKTRTAGSRSAKASAPSRKKKAVKKAVAGGSRGKKSTKKTTPKATKKATKKKTAVAAKRSGAVAKKKVEKKSPAAKAPKTSPKAKAAPSRRLKRAPSAKKKTTAPAASKRTAAAEKPVTKPAPPRAAVVRTPEPAAAVESRVVSYGSLSITLAPEGAKIPKTKLRKSELQMFERMLLDKREELVGDVQNLTNEALMGNEASGGMSNMPLHMADIGTDNWEQEFTLGLIDNERTLVREIDDARERIANRTYGVCLATHRQIDKARLRAKPWAKYCIEYARLKELGRVP
jgi:RNA polymerase-binding transcription factor